MTVKTALVALALTALPALAFAECEWSKQQAQSCAAGTVWDTQTHRCVEQVSS